MAAVEEGTRVNEHTFQLEGNTYGKCFYDIHLKPGSVPTKRPWRLAWMEAVENSVACLVAASLA